MVRLDEPFFVYGELKDVQDDMEAIKLENALFQRVLTDIIHLWKVLFMIQRASHSS